MKNSTFALVQKLIATVTLFGITSLFLLCLAIPLMSMADMDNSSPCGMNHATELCPMSLNEHLGFWQKILIPVSASASLLSLLVALVIIVVSLKDTATLEALQRLRLTRYHAGASPPLVDYLQQQFSQGILRPKIY